MRFKTYYVRMFLYLRLLQIHEIYIVVQVKGWKTFKESGYEQVYNRIYHFDDKELEKQRGWLKLAIQGNRDVDIKVGRKGSIEVNC